MSKDAGKETAQSRPVKKTVKKPAAKRPAKKTGTAAKTTAASKELLEKGLISSDAPGEAPFSVFVTEMDQYLFGTGVHYDIYKKLGAHETMKDGLRGIYFAVWAPNAAGVNLIGSFNRWNEDSHPMTRREPLGIYDLFVPEARIGDMYKFLVFTQDGRKLYKADPFASFRIFCVFAAHKMRSVSGIDWYIV